MTFYVLLALATYFSYLDDVPELVIDRAKGSGVTDWPMVIGKGFFSLSLVANFLLMLHPLRITTVVCLLGANKQISNRAYYMTKITLIHYTPPIAPALPTFLVSLSNGI